MSGRYRGNMKARNLIIGAVATVTLVAGSAATSKAAQRTTGVASISGVQIKLVSPSQIGQTGVFDEQIGPQAPSSYCWWDLGRYTDEFGYQNNIDTDIRSVTIVDLASINWGYTFYYITPYTCAGVAGTTVDTGAEFVPTIVDNPFSYVSVPGTGPERSVLRSTTGAPPWRSTARAVRPGGWAQPPHSTTESVVGTGPAGGIGTVHVERRQDGHDQLRIRRRSAGASLAFKYGTSMNASEPSDIDTVIATGKGKGGGYDMYFDAWG